jgi:hypothetical protein
LRDLPSRRSVGSYAIGEILLYFFVAMERYFDGTDQDNSNLCIFAANKKFNKAQLEFWSAPSTPTFDETLPNFIFTFRLARATIFTGQRIVSVTNKYNVGLHGSFTGQI